MKTGEQIKAKLNDRGTTCIFVRYAKKHAGNVYRMLNVKTNAVIVTRDVYWTNKMWYEQEGSPRVKVEYVETKTEEKENEAPEIETQQNEQEDSDSEESQNLEGTGSVSEEDDSPLSDTYWKNLGRNTPREIKGLRTYNNLGLMEQEEQAAHFCFLVNKLETKYSEEEKMIPTTFREAWDHPNPYKCAKWRDAIKLEFSQMIKNNVWRKGGINDLPGDRIGIGTKWIFTEKKNGIFRASLVAKGYDQIAGIDFQDNFAPVMSDVTFRMLLILTMSKRYYVETLDMKTAFLHGELEEEI